MFAKGLPRSPPSVLKNGRKRIFPLSHTWLTSHVLCSASTLLPYAFQMASLRISINATLPVILTHSPGCSDLKPHLDVEDLKFPQRWRGHACEAAQRRRTCPDLREKTVMVKFRISGGPSGQPRRLVPPTRRPLNDRLTMFAKGLPRSPPSVLKNGRKRIFPLSHTWLTSHVLCSASTLLTYAFQMASLRISINATLPVILTHSPGCSDLKPPSDVEDLKFPQR